MEHYDPGWERFKPTQEELFAEARRERDAARLGGCPARMVGLLPWPVRVLPGFMLKASLPVIGLALLFGAVSTTKLPPIEPLTVEAQVVTTGSPVVVSTNHLSLGESRGDRMGQGQPIKVTNPSPDFAVRVTIHTERDPRDGFLLSEYRDVVIDPGGTQELVMWSWRANPSASGTKQARILITATRR